MTTKQILEQSKALIDAGWTRIPHAVNERNQAVNPQSNEAVAFTINGAIVRVTKGRLFSVETKKALELIQKEIGGAIEILSYNNAPDRTKAEVIALLDSVITSA